MKPISFIRQDIRLTGIIRLISCLKGLLMQQKVNIRFSPPEWGWIVVTISSGYDSVTIWTSDVFDPYPAFVDWLRKIKDGNLPCMITIDEEGIYKQLVVQPVDEKSIRFVARDYDYGDELEDEPDYPRVYIDRIMPKEMLLTEFCTRFSRYQKSIKNGGWGENIADLSLNGLETYIE